MSPRRAVDRPRLEEFLRELGRAFRHPARLYLSGGEGMVWRGLRGMTQEVDVAYVVDAAHHDDWVRTLRALKERLSINVEEAQPADFIPLPPDADSRAEFVGRYGAVDVFLIDPYSIALSKLERGHDRDLDDVRKLLGKRIVDAAELRRLFEAIEPQYALRLNSDPDRFREKLDAVRRD